MLHVTRPWHSTKLYLLLKNVCEFFLPRVVECFKSSNKNLTSQLDDTGVGMVTGIIEDLVDAQNSSATENITQTLSNILDVSIA